LLFFQLVVTLTRLGVVMSTSRRSDLDDANDDGRKCQNRTDRPKDDGYCERLQGVGCRGRSIISVGGVKRARARIEVRAWHVWRSEVHGEIDKFM
jgi:hypothetical protein